MNKKKIWLEVAIRQKNALEFKKPILGFNWFSLNVWNYQIIEVEYIFGNSNQTINTVLDNAMIAIADQYGKTNVRLKTIFESWEGERIKVV